MPRVALLKHVRVVPPFLLISPAGRERLIICWHGTTEANANRILRRGFKEGTFFAMHVEDAFTFGGNHVFGVAFPHDELAGPTRSEIWQFVANDHIPPHQIVSLEVIERSKLYENPRLTKRVFESNERVRLKEQSALAPPRRRTKPARSARA